MYRSFRTTGLRGRKGSERPRDMVARKTRLRGKLRANKTENTRTENKHRRPPISRGFYKEKFSITQTPQNSTATRLAVTSLAEAWPLCAGAAPLPPQDAVCVPGERARRGGDRLGSLAVRRMPDRAPAGA